MNIWKREEHRIEVISIANNYEIFVNAQSVIELSSNIGIMIKGGSTTEAKIAFNKAVKGYSKAFYFIECFAFVIPIFALPQVRSVLQI